MVVLDNVWGVEHVEPFLVQGATSRVVFTTRDRAIATGVGAEEIHLDTMVPDEAVALLRLWAGREDPGYPTVAKRLGYHPLALRLAGTRLRETERTAATWLASFEKLSYLSPGRAATKNDNLAICFGLSTERLPAEELLLFHSLGIFPYQVRVPARFSSYHFRGAELRQRRLTKFGDEDLIGCSTSPSVGGAPCRGRRQRLASCPTEPRWP